MSQWGLNSKQIDEMYQKSLDQDLGDSPEALMEQAAQATLRHVYEEGERDCPEPSHLFKGPRFECPDCLLELKREAGL